mmetsp:Transcript_18865/g.45366  ORF Transcript_18865/g.45366 Transcript_18865/m.45366 type:complete len:200 (-) Transcript_18865:656-1255(-)
MASPFSFIFTSWTPSTAPPTGRETRVVMILTLTSWGSFPFSCTTSWALVPGQPAKALTLLCMYTAFSVNHSCPSSLVILSACVASASSCTSHPVPSCLYFPSKTPPNTSSSSSLPSSNSSGSSSSAFSSPPSTLSLLPTTGPASISNTVKSTDTPVVSTPASSARGTGAAPLNFGSSEGWMLRVPRGGMPRKDFGRNCP